MDEPLERALELLRYFRDHVNDIVEKCEEIAKGDNKGN